MLSFCKRKETLLVFAVIIPALILCTCCQREEGEGRAVRASVRSCCSFKKANGGRKICELKAGSVLGFGFFPLELVAG